MHKLEQTKNYNIFEMHEFNRPLHDNPGLLASMKKHGFMPSGALHVSHNGNGKLKIKRGHHRFSYAKRLGLPVWYIIDDTKADIFDLEGAFGQNWSGSDFLKARAKAGNKHCQAVLAWAKNHKWPIGVAASLVGGQSANSGNKVREIKDGTFQVGDLKHAHHVAKITDVCRDIGLIFAVSSGFITAVSMVCRIPEFDQNSFIHKIRAYGTNMRNRGRRDEFLDEIEALYNYAAKSTRMPVKFRAYEVARNRQESFGKKN